ncbi:hypothetical protein KDK95_01720 [Actinospica sp. MGRD01-02]|uniref:Carbohydrate kinase PfkB domain-containing protein n=1 Tax=Actinospica acidithermotolerans TaxID=2828514 RepID=A0A941E4I1_9ACTN|nr:PfkB family carbohydrate kinase [Actinospica acidithermotolerans]MBR7825006.1 hypothetical protein [Actinospica acidithermotolerans]
MPSTSGNSESTGESRPSSVVVCGPVGRDLVLLVAEVPDAGTSAAVRERREVLGGKGANQAVAFARLETDVALVGAVGDDDAGADVLARARADGIDVSCVARRAAASSSTAHPGTSTARSFWGWPTSCARMRMRPNC